MTSVTILGIDPGSVRTGFGIIQTTGRRHQYLASGIIRCGKLPFSERLHKIFLGISELTEQHSLHEVAIEQVFVSRNASSALKLGHARGAAMVAAMQQALPVSEYSPRQIKQTVVGYGGADKGQMQHMVKTLLNLTQVPQEDAADALAIALCHAHFRFSQLPA